MVVIILISILIAGSISIFDPFSQISKAKDAQRKNDLAQVQRALENYYHDNGKYPLSSAVDPKYRITNLAGQTVEWGATNPNFSPYMTILPKEPSGNKYYVYFSKGQSYYLYANLDRGGKDPGACNGGNSCSAFSMSIADFPPDTACGGTNAKCNYGVTSPNVSP